MMKLILIVKKINSEKDNNNGKEEKKHDKKCEIFQYIMNDLIWNLIEKNVR